MMTLTGMDDFNKLNLVVDGGTDYNIIRRALEFFSEIDVENMTPEQRLLHAIFGEEQAQRDAGKLLVQLRDMEDSIPLFARRRREAKEAYKRELREAGYDDDGVY